MTLEESIPLLTSSLISFSTIKKFKIDVKPGKQCYEDILYCLVSSSPSKSSDERSESDLISYQDGIFIPILMVTLWLGLNVNVKNKIQQDDQ